METNIAPISDREFGSEVSLAEHISRDVSLSSKRFKRQPDTVNGLLRKNVQLKALRSGQIIAPFYVRDDASQCRRKYIKTRLQKKNERRIVTLDCSAIHCNLES